MRDDIVIQEFEVLLANLEPGQTEIQNVIQQNRSKSPIYTNEELIGILDEASTPFEMGCNEIFRNDESTRRLTKIHESGTTSRQQKWPIMKSLRVEVERLEIKDIQTKKLLNRRKSENNKHLEITLQERKMLKVERMKKLLKLITDKQEREEKQREREKKRHERIGKQMRRSNLAVILNKARPEEERKKSKHREDSKQQRNQSRKKDKATFRKCLTKSPEPLMKETFEVPVITIKTEIIDLTDPSCFYVNLRFPVVDVVHFPLEYCEDIYQNCNIKLVENYLAKAETSLHTIGSQSITLCLLSKIDYARILAMSVRDFHVLSRISVKLRVQLLAELEAINFGPPRLNEEVDEFSQHFQRRFVKIGQKLCDKLAKVEVRDCNFFSVLNCVSLHLVQASPSILLSQNLIWQCLATMLKFCHVATPSKTFEMFLSRALHPPDVFVKPEAPFYNDSEIL